MMLSSNNSKCSCSTNGFDIVELDHEIFKVNKVIYTNENFIE